MKRNDDALGLKSMGQKFWIIPPAILVVVASIQVFLVEYKHFDRWEGGGFGMFASVDRESLRPSRLFVQVNEGEYPAFFLDWATERKRMLTMPNNALLEKEIELIKNSAWCLYECGEGNHCLAEGTGSSGYHSELRKALVPVEIENERSYIPYHEFLLPLTGLGCESAVLNDVKGLRLEVHRLVYRGDGVFSTELLNRVSGK